MARSRKGKKKGNMVSVDLSDVESSGRVSDGEYVAEVMVVEQKESSSNNDYLNWKLKVGGGIAYHTTSLQSQALWNLRATLEACGYDIPDDKFDIDLDALVGEELGVCIESEVYQGKRKPVVVEVFLASEVDDSGNEEEEEEEEEEEVVEKKSKAKSKKSKPKKLKKKSKVSWEDEDETYEGTVISIDDDVITVEDDEGDEWEIDKEEITLL